MGIYYFRISWHTDIGLPTHGCQSRRNPLVLVRQTALQIIFKSIKTSKMLMMINICFKVLYVTVYNYVSIVWCGIGVPVPGGVPLSRVTPRTREGPWDAV